MALDPRMSISNIDSHLEGKDEEYAPLADMPIKKLEFTPFKPAPKAAPAAAPSGNKQQQQQQQQAAPSAPETTFTPIQVFLRLKPLPEEVDASITRIDDETVAMHTSATASAYGDNSAPQIEVTEQDKYHFSHVFGPETQQQELYSSTAEPLVEQLFSGQDGLVFAYGPTNSGKTFTIQGGKEENAGILPRVLSRIFGHVQERKQVGEMWSVWVNFMEIYNESIYDLLEDRQTQVSESRPKCELKENNGRIIVKGLKQMQVRDAHEAVTVSRFGAKFRQTAETGSNDNSSRSHSVFNIKLFKGDGADVKDENQVFAKLSVVDLAGSERARKTKATGERLKEASNINVSLMNLGRCLEAIKWNQDNPGKVPHVVPFRHSNLTRIFQDHFMNASRMCMIIAVNPDRNDYDEAVQALRYGCIAKEIVVRKTISTQAAARSKAPELATNRRAEAAKEGKEKEHVNRDEHTASVGGDGGGGGGGGGGGVAGVAGGNNHELMGGEWEEVQVDDLVDELECMRGQVYELQARNAQLEDTIRAEVCEEMMKQMQEMERAFQVRMEDERIATEQKFERKIDIITREASRREYEMTQEEQKDLVSQLKFYKSRADEMQKEHKAALQRIMPSIESMTPESNAAEDDERVANLQSQVTALQRDLAEKTGALDSKRRQLNDNRQIIEAADSAIRTIENRLKCTEGQNDRLRSELGEAQNLMRDSQVRVSHLEESLRRAQDQVERLEGEIVESDRKHAAKVSDLVSKLADAEATSGEGGHGKGVDERAKELEGEIAGLRREIKKEGARASDLDREVDHLRGLVSAYEGVMTKKQKEDAKRRTENHVPNTPGKAFNTSPSYQSAASATKALQQAGTWKGVIEPSLSGTGLKVTLEDRGQAPATIAGTDAASETQHKASGAFGTSLKSPFPSLKSIFGRTAAQVSPTTSDLQSDDAEAKETGGGDSAVTALKDVPQANSKAGVSKKRAMPGLRLDGDKEVDVENCPLHLLEYMLPDSEPFKGTSSPFKKLANLGGGPTPLSPSAANIKAGGVHAATASLEGMTSSLASGVKSTTKTRKLFTANVADAEALNDAAGTTLVESTPIGRRTRSTRTELA